MPSRNRKARLSTIRICGHRVDRPLVAPGRDKTRDQNQKEPGAFGEGLQSEIRNPQSQIGNAVTRIAEKSSDRLS